MTREQWHRAWQIVRAAAKAPRTPFRKDVDALGVLTFWEEIHPGLVHMALFWTAEELAKYEAGPEPSIIATKAHQQWRGEVRRAIPGWKEAIKDRYVAYEIIEKFASRFLGEAEKKYCVGVWPAQDVFSKRDHTKYFGWEKAIKTAQERWVRLHETAAVSGYKLLSDLMDRHNPPSGSMTPNPARGYWPGWQEEDKLRAQNRKESREWHAARSSTTTTK